MLTTSQLRQSAALSGVRDIASIEIDVVLTHLLQLFHEHGLTEILRSREEPFSVKWFLVLADGSRPISILPVARTSAWMTSRCGCSRRWNSHIRE